MNIEKAKARFWVAMWGPVIVESPVARLPLVEFVSGLFEKDEKDEEEAKEDSP